MTQNLPEAPWTDWEATNIDGRLTEHDRRVTDPVPPSLLFGGEIVRGKSPSGESPSAGKSFGGSRSGEKSSEGKSFEGSRRANRRSEKQTSKEKSIGGKVAGCARGPPTTSQYFERRALQIDIYRNTG
eukprot:TRINITY_DN12757_c0_g2_i1.p2 TRINITY_DN12757_c0_g2~~TRINITY_DN12757_c0_g2_i1.p2  ORF type:complete len:128 (-),score=8.55 TRINITY_DN12757_c0_g2_i1:425-808(-)